MDETTPTPAEALVASLDAPPVTDQEHDAAQPFPSEPTPDAGQSSPWPAGTDDLRYEGDRKFTPVDAAGEPLGGAVTLGSRQTPLTLPGTSEADYWQAAERDGTVHVTCPSLDGMAVCEVTLTPEEALADGGPKLGEERAGNLQLILAGPVMLNAIEDAHAELGVARRILLAGSAAPADVAATIDKVRADLKAASKRVR